LTSEPERGTTTYAYAYNSTGLQVIRTNPEANQIAPSAATATRTTQYDSLGRVLTVGYSDGTPTKTFQYDSPTWSEASQQTNLKGRLSLRQLVSSAGTAGTLYSYDAVGNISFTYNCLPSGCGNSALDRGVFYGYDLAGILTSESDGSGVTYTYGRSPAGEVTAVTSSFSDGNDPANIVVPSSVQNSAFGATSFSLGNGTNQVNAYDTLGRNINGWVCNNHSTAAQCGGSGMLYGYGATWKGAQITSSLDTVQGTSSTYGYDEFNRLAAMNVSNGQTYQYLYDRWGNRWQQNAPQGGTTTTLNFNTANQVTGTGNSPNSYVYDIAGNLHSDGVNTYSYDAEGNLTAVVSGGNTTTYIYDTANRRIRTQGSGSPVEVIFDENGKRLSTWSSGSLTKANIYWDGRAIGYRTGGATHFEHQDWLGTERMRTTASGSVEGSYRSLPFGDGYVASGTDSDPYHFAGLDSDPESGTQHAQYRQYSAMQGRWLSPDPYDGSYDPTNPQSLNRYNYLLNMPALLTDTSGLDFQDCRTYEYSTDARTSSITAHDSGTFIDCFTIYTPESGAQSIDRVPIPKLPLFGVKVPNNPTQPGKQSKSACNAQRVANAIPGATLTGNNTFQGGHEEYGIQVSGADLAGARFSFYSSPFGNGNGYRTPFSGGHVNGQPGNIAIPYAYGETFAGQAHFDVGNASSGFGGFAEHSFVDVLLGTLLGWIPGLHNFLDPGC
jgi:RHS repeat-associated protein